MTTDTNRWAIGTRVEIPTHWDWWMRGARYGVIVNITTNNYWVQLDKAPKPIRIPHSELEQYGQQIA